jgi:hypothetical protein
MDISWFSKDYRAIDDDSSDRNTGHDSTSPAHQEKMNSHRWKRCGSQAFSKLSISH